MATDHALEVRRLLRDPGRLCDALGLSQGAKRGRAELVIRCPAHGDRNPSCSVRVAADGTLSVRCFACGFKGDALTLVAQALDLDTRTQFREVLAEAARLGGDHGLADEIRGGCPAVERKPVVLPPAEPPRDYPAQGDVDALWGDLRAVNDDPDVSGYLVRRRIDPDAVARLDLLRCLHPQHHPSRLPQWARGWVSSGHRLIAPVYDPAGAMRSVRSWRVTAGGDGAKRKPPFGFRASELVLANEGALLMLRGIACPRRVLVLEGEPDFIVAATRYPDACIGVGSGSWSSSFARRVPSGCEVFVWTHNDDQGDRYADQVIATLGNRCPIWRGAL